MGSKLAVTVATASILLGAAAPLRAGEASGWVDPPSALPDETVTYPDFPATGDENGPTATSSLPATEDAASVDSTSSLGEATPVTTGIPLPPPRPASQPSQTAEAPEELKRNVAKPQAEPKPPSRTAAVAERSRKRVQRPAGTREAAVRSGRSRTTVRPGRGQDVAPANPEFRTVREALDAGFSVTRIRTYYLPDGRRVEVVTELDPVVRSSRPY
jgi:hypothetical protein